MKTVKTGIDVVDDVIDIILKSGYRDAVKLNGVIARFQQPVNSSKEDVIVGLLALNAAQLQEGVINVNIHVPDINSGFLGKQPNLNRFRALIPPMIDLLNDHNGTNYSFTLDKPAEIIKDKDNSHFANIRLRYYSIRLDK